VGYGAVDPRYLGDVQGALGEELLIARPPGLEGPLRLPHLLVTYRYDGGIYRYDGVTYRCNDDTYRYDGVTMALHIVTMARCISLR
jgi:hypothetical protein